MGKGDRGASLHSVLILTGGSLVLWWALLAKEALALFAELSRLWH